MFLDTLDGSLLGNLLADKGVIRAVEGKRITSQDF